MKNSPPINFWLRPWPHYAFHSTSAH